MRGVLIEAEKIIKEIREAMPSLPRFKLRATRNRRVYGYFYVQKNEITLSRYWYNRHPETLEATILHEIAHYLQYKINPYDLEVHGPLFRAMCKKVSPILRVSTHDLIWRY